MGSLKQLALLAIFATSVYALPRHEKAIGIFNVVRFPNNVCDTGGNGNMNGTCYTAEECTARDGVATGSCADGYGVCCVITLSCGATTTENCTYLNQDASNTPATDDGDENLSCTYTICPATTSIRRIRLELSAFQIADPFQPAEDGSATNAGDASSSIGHCVTDRLNVIGVGAAIPTICGFNTGQHMVADTDGIECVKAIFSFAPGGGTSRNYRIHVLQFDQFNDMGGPAGCLQYFTGQMGIVNTFNWNGIGASTHLANQNYQVCVRQRIDACRICWAPVGVPGTDAIAGSFGISNSDSDGDEAVYNGVDDVCAYDATPAVITSQDFVIIRSGNAAGVNNADGLNSPEIANIELGNDLFCGRFLNVGAMATTDNSICSRVTPFRLGVSFDDIEVADNMNGAKAKANVQEASSTNAGSPIGTQGFSLGFEQIAC